MAEETKNRQLQFTEEDLIHMAQNEERTLIAKENMLERINNMLRETILAKEALEELKKTKGKIGVAIGATIIIEAEAANIKTCKRGINDNAYKEESIEDTITWLKGKEEQLKIQAQNAHRETTASQARLQEVVGILKQIEKEKRKAMTQSPPSISK